MEETRLGPGKCEPNPRRAISTGGCALPSSLSPSWRHSDPHHRLLVASDPVWQGASRQEARGIFSFPFFSFFLDAKLSESHFELAQD